MILDFSKPKKIRSTEEHNEMYSSDSGIPGTFVPNMSEEDMSKWKGKHIKGKEERIEIRKTLDSRLLIIVYKNTDAYENEWDHDMRISMNGPCRLTFKEWEELKQVVEEAREKLKFEDMKSIINFDKEWLINKFAEISEEWSNSEDIFDVEFLVKPEMIYITFTLDCKRYGIHKGSYIKIENGKVSVNLAEILEGGDTEAELEDALVEKINEKNKDEQI